MVRLGLLSLFVVLVGMVPVRMTHTGAWVVFGGGCAFTIAGAFLFTADTGRLKARLGLGHRAEAVLVVFRRTGLPILGLAFFLAWTVIYIGLWAYHPQTAFHGIEPRPHFADFFYYAVSTAFISPPGDVIASTRGTRSATMIEMLTAFALLTAYLSSFVDWYGKAPEPEPRVEP